MTGRERRDRDPLWLQQIRARLARIKVAKAARQTQDLQTQWDTNNVIESVLLRRRLGDDRDDTRRRHGAT